MMIGKLTARWALIGLGLTVTVVFAGCSGSNPNVGKAESALKQGDYRSALASIETALQQDSTDTDAYLLRARVLRQKADSTMPPDEYKDLHRRARQAEEQALAIDADLRSDVMDVRKQVYDREVGLGKLTYNRANKTETQDLYRRAVSHYGAAGMTRTDSARPVLNEAFARLRIGQRKAVIPVLEEYAERADTASRTAYKLLGQLYVSNGQPDRAVELLEEGTLAHPSDRELQALRLNAYTQAGNVDEALDAYRKQIDKRPKNPTYRYNYGALLLEAERYDDAIEQLRTAVELKPEHVGSQYNLGAAYVNAALAQDDSIAALEKGERPEPEADTTTREQRMDTFVQKRDSLFNAAVPPLERARKMGDASGTIQRDACRALLVAYVQTRRPNKAAQVEGCTDFSQAKP
jgi:Tfp pilus assembly protein PilF